MRIPEHGLTLDACYISPVMKRGLFLLLIAIPSCQPNVVVGFNHDAGVNSADSGFAAFDAGATDAGRDAGGDVAASDGGSIDAGAPDGSTPDSGASDAAIDAGGADAAIDAGPPDSGALDGSAPDSGASDAGLDAGVTDAAIDAGPPDSGALDGSTPDSGATDAGTDAGTTDAAIDAGPPDLTLDLLGPFVVELGDTAAYTAVATNAGGSPAAGVTATINLPRFAGLDAGVLCAPGGDAQVVCSWGTVAPGSSPAAFTLSMHTTGGVRRMSGAVETVSIEDAGNNAASTLTVVTNIGTTFVPVVPPRVISLSACFGSGLNSYAQCTSGSLVTGDVRLDPDGGVDSLGNGWVGRWGQSAPQRNLAILFTINGSEANLYWGQSVSAQCYEGQINVRPGSAIDSGVWRGCLN